ncbi:MAG: AAA family ATPase [Candidatus Marinimicrobia bacterium]|nr:AAA family ATPase [Candidatus Neomarinimicrobiota bacterium]MCF7850138.1 AAA family ATPase [Candidatus Neomarinimicrobiota bacterium]
MRIEKLTIQNFRSFSNNPVDVVFPKISFPISIVGYNNSGKSNLLDAIAYGLNSKSTSYASFDVDDFHNHQIENDFMIDVEISPPIQVPTLYNQFREISKFNLKVKSEEGVIDSQHYCVDAEGTPIFTPMTIKRGNKTEFSPEEKVILNEYQKKGAQTAYKWKNKVPIYFIDPVHILNQLQANRYTLLGKVLMDVRKEFESLDSVIPKRDGVLDHHVGKPNAKIFQKMLDYIEKQVLPTPKLEALTDQIMSALKDDLNIESDNFDLSFGFPSIDMFYKNMEFYIKESETKPKLPITKYGNGFIFLFVISLFKAIIESNNGGNIFIIEEPETYLHEHYQEYFYDILTRLSANNQVIYTTHSKKFVNLFEPQSIIKLDAAEDDGTKVIQYPEADLSIPEALNEYKLNSVEDFALYLKTLEPNIGNIIFAKKVIIVEGPHDLLGYKTVLSQKYNLEFDNISIVSAWGKDTIKSIAELCNLFDIKYFVIHDWDLDTDCDVTIRKEDSDSIYSELTPAQKAQYTKNYQIAEIAGINNIHHNKRNLESVLGITEKGTFSVFEKLRGKTVDQVSAEFPKFLDDKIIQFIELE